MTYYEKIKQKSFDEMCDFILHHIHSDCHGIYDEYCEAEGYKNCKDCIEQLLNRNVN